MLRHLERAAARLRWTPGLRDVAPLWDAVRPLYRRFLSTASSGGGISRLINATDLVRLDPALHSFSDTYEPDVWPHVVGEVRPGDRIVDVGASVGLYSVAMGKRAGAAGKVFAFEPDPAAFRLLTTHRRLNNLEKTLSLSQKVISDKTGTVPFRSGRGTESAVDESGIGSLSVSSVTLDDYFPKAHIDIIKIDVEGYEQHVLVGARSLLSDRARRPRSIYIEVHPFAWPRYGVSGASLLGFLATVGYVATDMAGNQMFGIEEYGEIVARPV